MNVKVDECQGGQLVWWTYVGWMDVGLLSVGWMDVLEPMVSSPCKVVSTDCFFTITVSFVTLAVCTIASPYQAKKLHYIRYS